MKNNSTTWRWHSDFAPHLRSFADILTDLDRLHANHVELILDHSNEQQGQDVHEQDTVYFRASVFLLCSAWEAFVEDLLENSIDYLVQQVDDPNRIPLTLRKLIARELKNDKNELSPWFLAGPNWKSRVTEAVRARVIHLNTPKSKNIESLYQDCLGVDILDTWKWTVTTAETGTVLFERANTIRWIDDFVSARGAIAHGRQPEMPSHTFVLMNIGLRLLKVASLMHNGIIDFMKEAVGTEPWKRVDFNPDWRPYLTNAPEPMK